MIKLCEYIETCYLRKELRDKNLVVYCFGKHIENCKAYKSKKNLENKSDYNGEPLGIGGADLESYVSCEEQLKRLREIK